MALPGHVQPQRQDDDPGDERGPDDVELDRQTEDLPGDVIADVDVAGGQNPGQSAHEGTPLRSTAPSMLDRNTAW